MYRLSRAALYFCACWLSATRGRVPVEKYIFREVASPSPPPPLSRVTPTHRAVVSRDDDDDDDDGVDDDDINYIIL